MSEVLASALSQAVWTAEDALAHALVVENYKSILEEQRVLGKHSR